jgi:lysophospholipase L1-like esterase
MDLRGRTIALVGDSHMEALGPRLKRALLAAGARSVSVVARRGWSARRYVQSVEGRAQLRAAGRADLVFIDLGGNNQEFRPGTYREQLRDLLEQVGRPSRVIWIGPPASSMDRAPETAARHQKTAELQRSILPPWGVRWIDSRPFTRADWAPDGVHFTRAGYDRWAARLVKSFDATSGVIWLLAGILGVALVLGRRRTP